MGMKQTLEVLDIWREFLISLFYLSGAEWSIGVWWRKPDVMQFIFQGRMGCLRHHPLFMESNATGVTLSFHLKNKSIYSAYGRPLDTGLRLLPLSGAGDPDCAPSICTTSCMFTFKIDSGGVYYL